MNIYSFPLIILIAFVCALQCHAFSHTLVANNNLLARSRSKSQSCRHVLNASSTTSSRRESIQRVFLSFVGIASSTSLNLPQEAIASDKDPIIWKSGKAPIVPGQKPKDKNDVSGTRKDPNFLRSIATCRSQCELSTGPDGFARSREECLSDCQDICCTTYEQCTFAIVPR